MMTRNAAWNINYTTSWCLVFDAEQKRSCHYSANNKTFMRASNSSPGRSTAGKQNWHYTM